jgi:hypothetical protein
VQNPASDFGLPGTRSPFCSSANFRTHYSSVKINISGTESHQLTSAQAGESGEDHQRPKPTWHQRQPPHPGGPRVRGCLTTLIPRGTAQSWRADLCITPAPWLASPVRRSPPDHSRCRLERTPRVQRPCCPRKRRQLRKLHCVSASRGVQPVSRCNAESPSNLPAQSRHDTLVHAAST